MTTAILFGQTTAILFGHATIGGMAKVVEVVSSNNKTAWVRRTHKGTPYGKPFKRHIRKHGVRIHGINIVRKDYMGD